MKIFRARGWRRNQGYRTICEPPTGEYRGPAPAEFRVAVYEGSLRISQGSDTDELFDVALSREETDHVFAALRRAEARQSEPVEPELA